MVSGSWGVGNREADACTATALRDDQWDKIKHFLPGARAMSGGTTADNRLFVDAVIIAIARASGGAIYPSATDMGRLFTDGTGDGAKGVMRVFEFMSRDADNEFVMIDATIVGAHQHAPVPKKRLRGSSDRPLA